MYQKSRLTLHFKPLQTLYMFQKRCPIQSYHRVSYQDLTKSENMSVIEIVILKRNMLNILLYNTQIP